MCVTENIQLRQYLHIIKMRFYDHNLCDGNSCPWWNCCVLVFRTGLMSGPHQIQTVIAASIHTVSSQGAKPGRPIKSIAPV